MTPNQLQIKLSNRLVDLSTPIIMGIVNATPDSFFRGNRFTSDKGLLNGVEKMVADGATIIDIGGYSTRPGASVINSDIEIERVSDAIELILKKFPALILSVDTFRAAVARHVVRNYGVAMINDIGGGTLDDLMFETIADLQVPYVLMHTRGTPQSMQGLTDYEDVLSEVLQFLQKRVARLHLLGVTDVIVDPGFGFAKTMEQNYRLLNQLSVLKEIKVPILVGLSRKSMLYNLLKTDALGALNATTAANMLALMGGASILRVHDVKPAMEAIAIFEQYKKNSFL